ncbi:MAG: twin-arginine translocase TatA/TatE family subunit [Woeseiaceae bacterium]|nr:twin-arginine translocase TatA/TatE family subunit [Woeseiaceae bacterium]
MSGFSFWEFFFICLIGLVVLGPKRLPQVANQLGSWIGQARRMTRVLKRQLEEELDLDRELRVRPNISHPPPRDDDSYSPLHEQPSAGVDAELSVSTGDGPAATDTAGDGTAASDRDERRDT